MKKYLGILVALALVLGVFIAAPLKVSATEPVVGDFTGWDTDWDDFTYDEANDTYGVPDGVVNIYDVYYLMNAMNDPVGYPLAGAGIGDFTGWDTDWDDFTYDEANDTYGVQDGVINIYDVYYLQNAMNDSVNYPLPAAAPADEFQLEEDELPPIIRVQD